MEVRAEGGVKDVAPENHPAWVVEGRDGGGWSGVGRCCCWKLNGAHVHSSDAQSLARVRRHVGAAYPKRDAPQDASRMRVHAIAATKPSAVRRAADPGSCCRYSRCARSSKVFLGVPNQASATSRRLTS